MEQSSVWQPIETAPSDQVEVIVCDPKQNPPVFTAIMIFGSWYKSSGGRYAPEDARYGDEPSYPTMWMPVPAVPNVAHMNTEDEQ